MVKQWQYRCPTCGISLYEKNERLPSGEVERTLNCVSGCRKQWDFTTFLNDYPGMDVEPTSYTSAKRNPAKTAAKWVGLGLLYSVWTPLALLGLALFWGASIFAAVFFFAWIFGVKDPFG